MKSGVYRSLVDDLDAGLASTECESAARGAPTGVVYTATRSCNARTYVRTCACTPHYESAARYACVFRHGVCTTYMRKSKYRKGCLQWLIDGRFMANNSQ